RIWRRDYDGARMADKLGRGRRPATYWALNRRACERVVERGAPGRTGRRGGTSRVPGPRAGVRMVAEGRGRLRDARRPSGGGGDREADQRALPRAPAARRGSGGGRGRR